MRVPDTRLDEAKALPMAEIADRLGLQLRKITATERAGPCPSCGGTDRFAINTARNVMNCRSCGAAGDQLALVMLAMGCDFKAALAWLVGERDLALDPAEAQRRREKAEVERARQAGIERQMRARAIRDARAIWAAGEGHDLTPAAAYLAGRGIRFAAWPPTLRCLPDHAYVRTVAGKRDTWHRGPCLLAAVQDAAGKVRAVHQTWIDPAMPGRKAEILGPDGVAQPAKLVRGSKKGGAIRLTPAPAPGGCLVVGEGIETTASVMVSGALPDAAFWAGVDLGNMAGLQVKEPGQRGHTGVPKLDDAEAFVPPAGIGRLIFLEDGDSAQPATRLQLLAGLRRAMALRPGLSAEIVSAPEGCDFNDLINTGNTEHDTQE